MTPDPQLRPEMVAFGIGAAVSLAKRLAATLEGEPGWAWEETYRHLQAAHAAASRALEPAP